MRMIFFNPAYAVQPGVELFVTSRGRSTFARIVGGAMRACWRKLSKALAQNAGFLDGGYYGREGLITANRFPTFSASPYFAARAFPIMRPKVTERPQQLPVDMFGYV